MIDTQELAASCVDKLDDEIERHWFRLEVERGAMAIDAEGGDSSQFIDDVLETAAGRGLIPPSYEETQAFLESLEQQQP